MKKHEQKWGGGQFGGSYKDKIPTTTEFSFDLYKSPVLIKFIYSFPKKNHIILESLAIYMVDCACLTYLLKIFSVDAN